MGAAALAADLGNVCVPLALGGALGSSCATCHDQLSQRVCVVDGLSASSLRCGPGAACSGAGSEMPFAVMGVVHDVHVVKGVVGTFTDNEPVIGVRAKTLPYTQAIGRPGMPDTEKRDALPLQRYSFGNFLFLLPGMQMEDDVVIAFGTRTVVRVPLLGATNAPLNFDVLGSTSMPMRKLLQSSQPVEIGVPIQPRGESLPQVVRSTLTFSVAPQSVGGGGGGGGAAPPLSPADDTDAVAPPEVCLQAGITERLSLEGLRGSPGGGSSSSQCTKISGGHQFNAV